jgi:uncharacterized RDD family membrane protein YckC
MPCRNHPEEVVGLVRCSRCGDEFCTSCVVELEGSFFCATCKREQVKDIQSGAAGAGTELATVGRRFGGLLVDGLIAVIPAAVVGGLVAFSVISRHGVDKDFGQNPFNPVTLAIIGIIAGARLLYEALMLQARGQTLGKMALSIKVVNPDGSDIGAGQAWGRALVKVLFDIASSFIPLFSLTNYIPAFVTKEKKCIHDMIAGTRVVNWRQ